MNILQSSVFGVASGKYLRQIRDVGPKATKFPPNYFRESPVVTLAIQPFSQGSKPGAPELVDFVSSDELITTTENKINEDSARYWVHYIAVGVIGYQVMSVTQSKQE